MRTNAHDPVFCQIFRCIFAHVGDVARKFFAYDTLVKHDSILVVVSLPRHVSNKDITPKSQFSILSCIALGEDIALFHTIALTTDRLEVNRCTLVRLAVFGERIGNNRFFKAYEKLLIGLVVTNLDLICIHVDNLAGSFCHNLRTRVANQFAFHPGTYDRSLGLDEGHCLAHHVRSHECTVGVVVLQERNQRSSNRGDLRRRNVHQVHLIRSNDGEVRSVA